MIYQGIGFRYYENRIKIEPAYCDNCGIVAGKDTSKAYCKCPSYRIVLDGDTLLVSDYIGLPDPAHAKPISVQDNEHWQNFMAFMKDCRWKKRYDSDILDGTQ